MDNLPPKKNTSPTQGRPSTGNLGWVQALRDRYGTEEGGSLNSIFSSLLERGTQELDDFMKALNIEDTNIQAASDVAFDFTQTIQAQIFKRIIRDIEQDTSLKIESEQDLLDEINKRADFEDAQAGKEYNRLVDKYDLALSQGKEAAQEVYQRDLKNIGREYKQLTDSLRSTAVSDLGGERGVQRQADQQSQTQLRQLGIQDSSLAQGINTRNLREGNMDRIVAGLNRGLGRALSDKEYSEEVSKEQRDAQNLALQQRRDFQEGDAWAGYEQTIAGNILGREIAAGRYNKNVGNILNQHSTSVHDVAFDFGTWQVTSHKNEAQEKEEREIESLRKSKKAYEDQADYLYNKLTSGDNPLSHAEAEKQVQQLRDQAKTIGGLINTKFQTSTAHLPGIPSQAFTPTQERLHDQGYQYQGDVKTQATPSITPNVARRL